MVDELNKDQSTEQKILTAAKAVFIEQGLAGARMQDIADKAGINKALLHYYFRNKEKLFDMVFAEAAAKFMPRISMLFEADVPLFDKIRLFVDNYMNLLTENPFIPIFVLNEVHKNPEEVIMKIWGGRMPPINEFAAQIHREVAAGTIKPIKPIHLMLNMISMCIFPFVGRPIITTVFNLGEHGFNAMIEERKQQVADFVIDALRP
ncbi:TetR/AcrR family transcriptional regulator [Paraflavitalea pollutisoli]|uniref:TetR/AcrR family transcriptional regulator n=1 Tax=Paraflavitalea pollutisoli TaxID=3034143 RepID=UPI0023EA839F|nr:TetR/AcrR family transcriptional regulator [Paraflavitalea sp. H1-2-19X]